MAINQAWKWLFVLSFVGATNGIYIRLIDFDQELLIEGTTRVLECVASEVPNLASVHVSWYKDGQPITQTQQDSRNKYNGLGTPRLTINGLRSSDDGEYKCGVQPNPSVPKMESKNYKVNVVYGYNTKVSNIDPSKPIISSSWVVLKCDITRDGSPSSDSHVTWYRDDVLLQPLTTDVNDKYVIIDIERLGFQIKIASLSKFDSGKYRCNVDNKVQGGNQESYDLHVHYMASKPAIKPDERTFQAGGNITLTCHVEDPGYPPVITFTWLDKHNVILGAQDTPHYVLHWNDVKSEEVTCYGSSDKIESPRSDPVTVTSVAGPYIEDIHMNFTAGQKMYSIHLECTASWSSEVTWYKENRPIETKDIYEVTSKMVDGKYRLNEQQAIKSTLTLNPKDSYHTCDEVQLYNGAYTCKAAKVIADKTITKTSRTELVSLIMRPVWNESVPRIKHTSIGEENVMLTCAVCGTLPDDPVIWTHKGEALPDGVHIQDNILIIANVKAEHLGSYSCSVLDQLSKLSGAITRESFDITLADETYITGRTKDKDNTGMIVAIVVVIAVVFIIICLIFVLLRRRRRNQGQDESGIKEHLYMEIADKKENPDEENITNGKVADEAIKIPLLGPPDPPLKPVVRNREKNVCTLEWELPEGTSSNNITSYLVKYYKVSRDGIQCDHQEKKTSDMKVVIENMTSETHVFHVIAINEHGQSNPSEEVTSAHVYEEPPQKPNREAPKPGRAALAKQAAVEDPQDNKVPPPSPMPGARADRQPSPAEEAAEIPKTSGAKLLVLGGINCDWTQLRNKDGQGQVYKYADTLDIDSGTIDSTATEDMPLGRFKSSGVIYGDFVYIIGGASRLSGNRPKTTYSVYKYCLSKKRWDKQRDMSIERIDATAFNIQGFIFVAGGWNPSKKQLDDVECYDIEQDNWITKRNLPNRLDMLASCVIDNRAYISGGRLLDETVFSGILCYECVTDQWQNTGVVLHKARWDHAMGACKDQIFICGGGDGRHILNYVEQFDTTIKQVTVITPMPFKRKGTTAVSHDGKIYIVGGWGRSSTNETQSKATDTILVYDITTKSWTEMDKALTRPVAWASCILALI